MEEHRLKEMPNEYDEKVFLELFNNTKALRKSLAYGVDHRRFGVENQDIESWFNSKFIFIFNRYYEEAGPDELKAKIIKGLQLFKNRVLRKAYTAEAEAISSMMDVNELYDNPTYSTKDAETEAEEQLVLVKSFMKEKLSKGAYDLFLAQLSPPIYILQSLIETPKLLNRIPKPLLAEYFDISVELIDKYRKEIRNCIRKARQAL